MTHTKSDRASTFFDQWKLLFGEVCGYDLDKSNEKIKKLGRTFGVSEAKAAPLLFSIHTYYAVFMKLLAAEICSSFSPLPLSILAKCKASATDDALRSELEALESGGIWAQMGVSNFLEGDIFSWYLSAWNPKIASVMREMVDKFGDYDPRTLSVDPEENRDLLKHLYQDLIPKSIRHDLGEYYTADWLAEYVLDSCKYDGNPDLRVLDPACGSGTFLVVIINRIRAWFGANRHSCGFGEAELLQKILANVVGFDLNPLAVMASRVNVLLSLRDLFRYGATLNIPVFLCDFILTPASHGSLFTGKLGSVKRLKTSIGEIYIPSEVAADSEVLGRYTELLERAVKQEYRWDGFAELLRVENVPAKDVEAHKTLFKQLTTLHASGKDGIWARIIRNSFAPVLIQPVDYIIGNPPWINWESLPGEYRDDLKPTWQRYGLFSLDAVGGSMGGGKKDLSMLFVYLGVDKYLKANGIIAFVITQTLFKTTGAGDGFRSLRFDDLTVPGHAKRVYIKPLRTADLSRIQVFDGAANRTAVFVAQKVLRAFSYPVPYELWFGPGRLKQDLSKEAVLDTISTLNVSAAPVLGTKRTSPWLTVPKLALAAMKKVAGPSDYQARAGCTTWMNGIFWVEIVKSGIKTSLIRNMHDVGKTKGIKQVTMSVESALVYPLLRGRDVTRWKAMPSCHIVLTQDPATRTPITESLMKSCHAKTYGYLQIFKEQLKSRSGYKRYFVKKGGAAPFYALYNVGPYTMAPWKVLWPEVGHSVAAGVVGPQDAKSAVPDHTLIFVGCQTATEAHYICGVINSAPVELLVRGYIALHPSPHVLETVRVPRFDPKNVTHIAVAKHSTDAHKATSKGDEVAVARIEKALGQCVSKIFGLTAGELLTCTDSLDQLLRFGEEDFDSSDDELTLIEV